MSRMTGPCVGRGDLASWRSTVNRQELYAAFNAAYVGGDGAGGSNSSERGGWLDTGGILAECRTAGRQRGTVQGQARIAEPDRAVSKRLIN
jgi:hypothetical protein